MEKFKLYDLEDTPENAALIPFVETAQTFCDAGDYTAALAELDEAIKIAPSNDILYINRGVVKNYELNESESALTDFNKAIELNPNNYLSYYFRGIVIEKLDNKTEALKNYDKAIELEPNKALFYMVRAGTKVKIEDFKGAIIDYDKAIEIEPESNIANLYAVRGNVKFLQGDYEGTIKDLDKAIEIELLRLEYKISFPIAHLYFSRGLTYFFQHKYSNALQDFDKSIELKPDNTLAYFQRGLVQSNLKDYQMALLDYNKAIELNPNDALSYLQRAETKDRLGDTEAALKDYDKLIEINPSDAATYNNRGNLKKKIGDKEGALKDYNKAIELNPNNAFAHANRGRLKIALGQENEALEDVRKMLDENPQFKFKSIQRVEIKNLWGEYHIDWKPKADVTVLAGRNGSGKSTILRLIAGVLTGNFLPSARDAQVTSIRLTFDNNFSFELNAKEIEILSELNAGEPEDAQIHALYSEVNTGKEENLLFTTNYLLALLKKKNLYLRPGNRSSWALEYLLPVFVVDTFDPLIKSQEGIRMVTATMPWITSELDFQIGVLQTKYKDYQIDIGNRAIAALTDRDEQNFARINAKWRLFFERIDEFFAGSEKKIAHKEKDLLFNRRGGSLTPDKLSAGEKQLLILLLTALIQDEKPCVFLLDEPENSLHTTWQRKIIKSIRELNPNTQIIYATHSPGMLLDGGLDKIVNMSEIRTNVE